MPAPIEGLYDELLLCVFQSLLYNRNCMGLFGEQEHMQDAKMRATIALVSRHWKEVIYGAAWLWTQIHYATAESSNKLALTLSRDAPLHIDFSTNQLYSTVVESLRAAFGQMHRWKSVCLRLPLEPQLQTLLAKPAPLLEDIFFSSDSPLTTYMAAPFRNKPPRLRSVSLYDMGPSWSPAILADLKILRLGNLYSLGGEDYVWIMSILQVSPELEHLEISDLRTALPDAPLPDFALIDRPYLRVLDLRDVPSKFAEYLLHCIRAPVCREIHLMVFLNRRNGDDAHILYLSSLSSFLIPSLPLKGRPTLSIRSHSIDLDFEISQAGNDSSISFRGGSATNMLHHMFAILPLAFCEIKCEVMMILDEPDGDNAALIMDAADVVRATKLTIYAGPKQLNDILQRLSTSKSGWVFPLLEEMDIDLRGCQGEEVSAGSIARMAEARCGVNGDVELPARLSRFVVWRAHTRYDEDRARVEAAVGPNNVVWDHRSTNSWDA